MQTQTERVLTEYSDLEKGAYLAAIASLATADRTAGPEEIQHLETLADAAELSPAQKAIVVQAATDMSGEDLRQAMEILKKSDLRFSLVTDMISFAEADGQYGPEEKERIEKVGALLEINQKQFSLLDQFVHKAAENPEAAEKINQPGFLSSLGLDEKFKSAGINMSSLTKGLLGIAGPMILASLFRGGMGGSRNRGMGGLGGGIGGGGGIGSIISMLSGGRGFNNAGGLLSRILRF